MYSIVALDTRQKSDAVKAARLLPAQSAGRPLPTLSLAVAQPTGRPTPRWEPPLTRRQVSSVLTPLEEATVPIGTPSSGLASETSGISGDRGCARNSRLRDLPRTSLNTTLRCCRRPSIEPIARALAGRSGTAGQSCSLGHAERLRKRLAEARPRWRRGWVAGSQRTASSRSFARRFSRRASRGLTVD